MNYRNANHILLIAALITAAACDDDNDINNINAVDREFVTKATIANRAEVELGALAVERGENNTVKTFGNMMKTEHQEALNELETVAESNDIDTPDGLDAKHEQIKPTSCRFQITASIQHTSTAR